MTWVLILLAVGCLVLFVGVALISSRLVKPLAWILAWPAGAVAGAAGRLARENCVRNPARTAVTASALMIGLALVTFVAVLGQGLQDSLGDAVESGGARRLRRHRGRRRGPLAGGGSALASQPGVETVSGVRQDSARVFGSDESVDGVDPAHDRAGLSFDWDALGSFAGLGASGAVLQREFADEHDLGVGSALHPDGAGEEARADRSRHLLRRRFDPILGPILVSRRTFDSTFERPQDVLVLVDVRGESARRASARAGAGGASPRPSCRRRPSSHDDRRRRSRTSSACSTCCSPCRSS